MSFKTNATFQLRANGQVWTAHSPQVMGIVNCTPDSFFSGNRFDATEEAICRALEMLSAGAHVLDIGGQSTRPNATEIPAIDEWNRIKDVIAGILNEAPRAVLSVDTFHSQVADKALNAGAFMINDVFAGRKDPAMIDVVRNADAPFAIMHMKGNPETMQMSPAYMDVQREIYDWLNTRCTELREQGITQLVIDPGFGFGKTTEHNFELLQSLDSFQTLGHPVLAGLSRKSMIYKSLGTSPEEALNGTTALHAWALDRGANILRVHDVKEALETVQLFQLLNDEKLGQ